MSSSFRKATRVALCAVAVTGAPLALGQQWYFIPRVEASAEWSTNRELVSNESLEDSSQAYLLTLEGTAGVRSQRGSLELRPRVVGQEYPDRSGVDPLELGLDLRSRYETLKSEYTLRGRFRRRDTLNAEYGDAAFDDFDPEAGRTGEGGIVLVGTTRTDASVNPAWTYRLSDLNSMTLGLGYEMRDYEAVTAFDRVGFDATDVEVWFNRLMRERLEVSAGAYLSRYEADDGSNETDSVGAQANVRFASSQLSSVSLLLRLEESDITEFSPARVESSDTSWGAELTGTRRFEVGDIRFSIGRFLEPSSIGGRAAADEIRVQYNRPLSARLQLSAAARYNRDQRIDRLGEGDDVKRARVDASVRWLWTPTLYVAGGYRFARQDAASEPNSADDHTFFVSFGFLGLDDRARRVR